MECYDSSIKELISISHKKPKSEVQNMLSKLECLMWVETYSVQN